MKKSKKFSKLRNADDACSDSSGPDSDELDFIKMTVHNGTIGIEENHNAE